MAAATDCRPRRLASQSITDFDVWWEAVAVASTSPFVHVVGNANAETLEYRAAYMNSKGQQGPWSEVDSAYVGAAA